MLSCVLLFLYWWEIPLGFEFYVVTLSCSGCPFLCALGLRNKARTSWSAISRLQLRLLTVCWLYIQLVLSFTCTFHHHALVLQRTSWTSRCTIFIEEGQIMRITTNDNQIPYSRKYWRSFNLAVWSGATEIKILADLNLTVVPYI